MILGLMVVGCGKTKTEKLEEDNRRMKAQLDNDKLKVELEIKNKKLKDKEISISVVGTYEFKEGENVYRTVFLASGIVEWYTNGKKDGEGTWKLVKEEIHSTHKSVIVIYRINKDGSIIRIAWIEDGKRNDHPKDDRTTLKKIK